MICPKCNSVMSAVAASYGESVDRCEQCRGLFVSEKALALIQREWFRWPKLDTGRIDSGEPAVGARYDDVGPIDCPACGTRMAQVCAPEQSHIWLEQCGNCSGLFFDAGELTDLRYTTFLDWLRDALKPRRQI